MFLWNWLLMGPLSIPQMMRVNMKHLWNDTDQENRRIWRRICPSAILSTTNLTRTALGVNPGLHGEKLVTNHLSMAQPYFLVKFFMFYVC
jgi:hypothetical protein